MIISILVEYFNINQVVKYCVKEHVNNPEKLYILLHFVSELLLKHCRENEAQECNDVISQYSPNEQIEAYYLDGDILEGEILFNEELYYYEKGSIVSKQFRKKFILSKVGLLLKIKQFFKAILTFIQESDQFQAALIQFAQQIEKKVGQESQK